MLARRRVRSSVVLLGLLLVGVAAVGALTAGSVRDLVHRDTSTSGLNAAVVVWTKAGNEGSEAYRLTLQPASVYFAQAPDGVTGVFASGSRPLAWLLWTSLPATVVLLTLLGLMAGIAISARRRGRFAPRTLRLIRVAGLVGLFGGLAAAGIEALGAHWTTPPNFSYTPTVEQWQLAALLGLIGCALLAVREVLAQAGEMHAELETVI
jgi:hypothetical protein